MAGSPGFYDSDRESLRQLPLMVLAPENCLNVIYTIAYSVPGGATGKMFNERFGDPMSSAERSERRRAWRATPFARTFDRHSMDLTLADGPRSREPGRTNRHNGLSDNLATLSSCLTRNYPTCWYQPAYEYENPGMKWRRANQAPR